MSSSHDLSIQLCLDRLRRGDPAAREELLRRAGDRLERLTRKMLKGYPGVRRWTETADVLQNALLRLLRALEQVHPATVRDFFGLAALQVRRELLDLARHFLGPHGVGAHHASRDADASESGLHPDDTYEPGSLAEWREFHEQVEALPEVEREVVGLVFYHGLEQAEAAEVLDVTVRTVQRRWRSALQHLRAAVQSSRAGDGGA
jgi:RNA polymerase sigma-70 factor (ECF subfamily)